MSKFCKNCGKPLNDDVKFCNYCGFNQDNNPPAPPQPAPQPNPQTNFQPGTANQATPPPPPQNAPAPKQKSGCLKKALIILAGVLVVIILIISCNSSSNDKKDANTKPAATTSTSKDNAAKNSDSKEKPKKASLKGTSVKADAMLQEFIKDQNAASEKYKNQTFKITGKVSLKDQYSNSNSFYTIISSKNTGGKNYAIGISYSESQVDKVNKVKVGDFVNVEVEYRGIAKQDDPNKIYIQLDAKTLFDF